MTTNATPDGAGDDELRLDDRGDRPDQIPEVFDDPTSPDASEDDVDLTPYPLPSAAELEEAGDE